MPPVSDSNAPILERQRLFLWLGLGVVLLNLLVVWMAVGSLRQGYRNRQERATAMAQNLALVLDHYVADTFAKADIALRVVQEEAEREGRRGDGLDGFMQRQLDRVPGLRSLRITDAAGRVLHSSRTGPDAPAAVGDRAYFLRLKEDPEAGLVISKPLLGRVSGTWVIVTARRLIGPGRRFDGIVYGVIPLDPFQQAFAALNLGPHGSVALRTLDLDLVARYPEPGKAGTAVGEKLVSQEFQTFARSGREAGVYRARTPFDRVQRTFGIRRVSGQPFFILVGVADQDFLAGWWKDALQECLEVVLIAGLSLAGFWVVRRDWLRQKAIQADLEQALAEVKTLGGMLPICSHCKKIRDDRGYWNQLEAYLNTHTDAEFTHGICPDCAETFYPRDRK